MRIAATVAVLALLLLGARLGLEPGLDGEARRWLDEAGLLQHASYERLEFDLPWRLGARGLQLLDAYDGTLVGRLDSLAVQLVAGLGEAGPVQVQRVVGHGGRVEIRTGADEITAIPFIRSLIGLIDAIVDAVPAGDGGSPVPMPRLEFRDIEAVVHADGHPLLRYPGIDVDIVEDHPGGDVTVTIVTGGGRGELVLVFDGEQLTRIAASDLVVGPSIELLLGRSWGSIVADLLAPVGRVDLEVLEPASDSPRVMGEVRDARLQPLGLPFPLELDRLPFRMLDGRLLIENGPVRFPEGSATLDVSGNLETLDIAVAVHDSAFRASYLALVPAWRKLSGVRCEDGGSFDLALRMRLVGQPEAGAPGGELPFAPQVSGGGGFHVARLHLDELGLAVDDLMGRFRVEEDALVLSDLSATVSGGRVRVDGVLGLADDHFELDVAVEDLDVERFHEAIHPGNTCGNDLAGWLQSSLTASGSFADLLETTLAGQLSVRSGKLMETNLLTSIFSGAGLLRVPRRDEQRLGMVFSAHGRRLYVDPVALDLGPLALTGTGWVDETGRLGLQLVLIEHANDLIGQVLGFIQRNLLLQIEVTGSLNHPVVRAYPVAVITRSLAQALDFFAWALTGGQSGGTTGEDDGD